MSGGAFDLHVLVLSEDSAGSALASLRALARSMLRLVDPSHQEQRVDLEPEDEEAQRAMHANLWKGHKKAAGHQKLVTISRAIALERMRSTPALLVALAATHPDY